MLLNKKLREKETSIKLLLESIKSNLNTTSVYNKQNRHDWKYLTVLSFTENKLMELESQKKEILKDL